MEKSKSWEIDRLPIEFYKSLYKILKYDLLRLCNFMLFQNKYFTVYQSIHYHFDTKK